LLIGYFRCRLPKVPFSFHIPEDKVAVVSLEGAEVGNPLSKFSVIVFCAFIAKENIKAIPSSKSFFIKYVFFKVEKEAVSKANPIKY
jgi:hypothetical protein